MKNIFSCTVLIFFTAAAMEQTESLDERMKRIRKENPRFSTQLSLYEIKLKKQRLTNWEKLVTKKFGDTQYDLSEFSDHELIFDEDQIKIDGLGLIYHPEGSKPFVLSGFKSTAISLKTMPGDFAEIHDRQKIYFVHFDRYIQVSGICYFGVWPEKRDPQPKIESSSEKV